jgi:hypothetical protein
MQAIFLRANIRQFRLLNLFLYLGWNIIKYIPNTLWHLNIYLIKNSSNNTINTGVERNNEIKNFAYDCK